jgi:hypothetical protein
MIDDIVTCGGQPHAEDKDKRMLVERLMKGSCDLPRSIRWTVTLRMMTTTMQV